MRDSCTLPCRRHITSWEKEWWGLLSALSVQLGLCKECTLTLSRRCYGRVTGKWSRCWSPRYACIPYILQLVPCVIVHINVVLACYVIAAQLSLKLIGNHRLFVQPPVVLARTTITRVDVWGCMLWGLLILEAIFTIGPVKLHHTIFEEFDMGEWKCSVTCAFWYHSKCGYVYAGWEPYLEFLFWTCDQRLR